MLGEHQVLTYAEGVFLQSDELNRTAWGGFHRRAIPGGSLSAPLRAAEPSKAFVSRSIKGNSILCEGEIPNGGNA